MKKGIIFVISAPSGAGKNTVINEFMKKRNDFVISVSATTRQPRAGETDGVNYFFYEKKKFLELVRKGAFLEHAKVLDNYYGTPKAPVLKSINAGKNVIMDVDIQGARSIKKKAKGCVTIFIIPQHLKELENRLRNRKTETPAVIRKRLELGRVEFAERKKFDYILINDTVDNAVRNLGYIVDLEINEKK